VKDKKDIEDRQLLNLLFPTATTTTTTTVNPLNAIGKPCHPPSPSHTIKKIFLIYKEIQMGSVAKSYSIRGRAS
jgi:hypothetical protein